MILMERLANTLRCTKKPILEIVLEKVKFRHRIEIALGSTPAKISRIIAAQHKKLQLVP